MKSKLKKEKQKEIAEKETDLCCAAKKKSNQIILKKKGKRKKRLYGRNRKKNLLYLFHHCIVLGYNLAASLQSIRCQARSQNNSQDKTNERLWEGKVSTSKQQTSRAAIVSLKWQFFNSFSHSHHTFSAPPQNTTTTRHLL